MEDIIISSGPGHFAINGTKYYRNPVKVRPLQGTISIISIADNSVIARGSYAQFRNGNDSNAEFNSEAELLTFFDTVFNIGGGDGSGVTSNVFTLAEYNAIVDKGSTLYFIKA